MYRKHSYFFFLIARISFINVTCLICNLFARSGIYKMNIFKQKTHFWFTLKKTKFLYSIPLCWFNWFTFFFKNAIASAISIDVHGRVHYLKNISHRKKKPFVLFSKTHKMPSMHSCALFFSDLKLILYCNSLR